MYQLYVLKDGVMQKTSWPPRSYRSASAVARYYRKVFPQYEYWLQRVD